MKFPAGAVPPDLALIYICHRSARNEMQIQQKMQCMGRRETTHKAPRFFSRLPLQPPPPSFPSPQPSFTAPQVRPPPGISTETRHGAFERAASERRQPRYFQGVDSCISEGGRTCGRDGRLRGKGRGVGVAGATPVVSAGWAGCGFPSPPALHFVFHRAPIRFRFQGNAQSSSGLFLQDSNRKHVPAKAHITPCNFIHD
jgi:hypothetical protein